MEKVLLLLNSKVNQTLISEFLKSNYDIRAYKNYSDLSQADLIIIDAAYFPKVQKYITSIKSSSELFVPVLFISSKRSVNLINSESWQNIDSVLTSPIYKMQLLAIVEVLLYSRRQSFILNKIQDVENDDTVKKESSILTNYFFNVSHELRTPLSIIMSGLDALIAGLPSDALNYDENKNLIDTLRKNCNRLLRIINNLLDISKVDTGNLTLNLKNIDPAKTIASISDTVQGVVKEKRISLDFISDTSCRRIAVDEDMFIRVILNLLSNAIKYTPPGGAITVTLQDSHLKNGIFISIKDNGIGIPADKQKIIFDPFCQVDETLSKRYEGCGLGLSLSKSIIERHGGRIWVESKIGIGSSFNFELPVRLTADKPLSFGPDINERITYELSSL